jgi:hypothetical protein
MVTLSMRYAVTEHRELEKEVVQRVFVCFKFNTGEGMT